jgi:hypothetical protein
VSLADLRILLTDGAYGGIDRHRDLHIGQLNLDGLLGRARGALAEELDERRRRLRVADSTITHIHVEDTYPAATPADLAEIAPEDPHQPPAGS